MEIQVVQLEHARDLPLPDYATPGAAGMDLVAAIDEPVVLFPGCRTLIPTGLTMAIPEGFEGQVRGRSGLAIRNGVGLVNSPGTIDSDYRGEVKVILINWGSEEHTIRRGDRIAQLVIAPVARATMTGVESLSETARGEGGFGHTG